MRYEFTTPTTLVRMQYIPQQMAFLKALAERHCANGHCWSITWGDPRTVDCPVCQSRGQRDYDKMLLLAGRQGGKALALDTPIPTVDGWKMMRDISVGDVVFDEKGRPTRVSYVSPIYIGHECYRLEFSDGTWIVADADHEWVTLDKRARKRWNQPAQKRTTREIAHTVLWNGESNHAIPLCEPLRYSPLTAPPIPPYTLGAWLGDGSSRGAEITCIDADAQILDEIRADGFEIRSRKCVENKARVHAIGIVGRWRSHTRSLAAQLRALGVLGRKHIPEVYLRAGIDTRLALLQGLMDTDGSCAPDGEAEFCSTNPDLAAAVYELVVGLGVRPRLMADNATLYGRVIGPRYRVCWTHTLPVFRLQRKRDRLPKTLKMSQYFRYIRRVVSVPSVPVRCIQVEAASHQYLASGACIPTHNTRVGTLAGVLEASMPNARGWISAPTYRDLVDVVEPAFFAQAPADWLNYWSLSDRTLKLPHGAHVAFRSLHDPNICRGPELDFWIIDEACQTSDEVLEIGDPMLSIRKGVAILTTTPQGEDWVYDKLFVPAAASIPGYWFATWKSADNPSQSKDYLAQKRATMSPEMYAQEYEASIVNFKGAIYGGLIDPCVADDTTPEGLARIRQFIPSYPIIPADWQTIVGLDPGSDHPFAGVPIVVTPRGIVVTGEYEERERPAAVHAQYLKGLPPTSNVQWVCDRSQAQTMIELAQHGIFAVATESGPGSVLAGIERVKSWLLSGQLIFVKSQTQRLVSRCKSYRWAETKKNDGSTGKQEPYKRGDDLPDGLRYALMAWPQLPDMPILTGERDLSHFDDKTRRDIARMQSHEAAQDKDKAAAGVGEFHVQTLVEDYGGYDSMYANW